MIWSSSIKSACVTIALLGLGAPEAGAIEMQGARTRHLRRATSRSRKPLSRIVARPPWGHAAASTIAAEPPLAAIVAARTGAASIAAAEFTVAAALLWRRGLSRRVWRVGAAELYHWGRRRDRGRRCDRRLGHRRGHRLRGPAARAAPALVLQRPQLPAGVLDACQ